MYTDQLVCQKNVRQARGTMEAKLMLNFLWLRLGVAGIANGGVLDVR
jgi:hypothetical protein